MFSLSSLGLLACFIGSALSSPRKYSNTTGTTFFSVGQNYLDEWEGFQSGVGKTPAGISVYGDVYSGALNSDSLNILPAYAAKHSGYVEVGMSWKDAMTQNGYTQYEGAKLCTDISSGKYDSQLTKLATSLAQYPHVHYLFRIDYEVSGNLHANTNPTAFDQSTWDTTAYPKAFAHVRKTISSHLKNVHFVYHAVRGQARVIYPGDHLVDYVGVSVFNNDVCLAAGNTVGCSAGPLDQNLQSDLTWSPKPKLIAESAVQAGACGSARGFIDYLKLVKGLVEAQNVAGWTYINSNWTAHGWDAATWGDSRIEVDGEVLAWFRENIVGDGRFKFGA